MQPATCGRSISTGISFRDTSSGSTSPEASLSADRRNRNVLYNSFPSIAIELLQLPAHFVIARRCFRLGTYAQVQILGLICTKAASGQVVEQFSHENL